MHLISRCVWFEPLIGRVDMFTHGMLRDVGMVTEQRLLQVWMFSNGQVLLAESQANVQNGCGVYSPAVLWVDELHCEGEEFMGCCLID